MLKALELIGFKSFADKTRFEFPSGITVVVGPNGSGKSNIVDAVKWVLGEQRVKSLRGTEMADVIFNGSGARRAMNSAEITLTLDNSTGLLAIDTPEVYITRRVYRSGEGEYLINRQPCRLRDIRDLLSGTGLGTQAYSVIEQGKVDVLLQSSARERRVIFEEAAGISRFKAKKIEALRRLERVEQNLLRLSDIVDEVDNRLRGMRSQAGKARRFKEYTNRLQELRTQVGSVDWSRLSDRLAGLEAELALLAGQREASAAEAEVLETRLLEAETQIADVTEGIRGSEARIAVNRERIAALESTVAHQRVRARDLEAQIARHRRQLSAMSVRAGGLQQQVRRTGEAVEAAVDHHRQIARVVAEGERGLTEVIQRLDRLRGENEQRRAAHMEQLRAAAVLGNEISGLETQVEAARAAEQRSGKRIAELDQQLAQIASDLGILKRKKEELSERADQQSRRLAAARGRLSDRQQQLGREQRGLAQLENRQIALGERASVLDELERRQEGISPGVKEVLAKARSGSPGPYRQVRGLVADVLRADVEAASLVEVVLGPRTQHLVAARSDELVDHLKSKGGRLPGRVGFVWLDGQADPAGEQDADLAGRPGVVDRADTLVQTEPEYARLANRLLGSTWVVETLDAALALRKLAGGRFSFVTLAGELLAADGTLSVGTQHTSTGLISRRSELRALKTQLEELDVKIRQAESSITRLDGEINEDRQKVDDLTDSHRQAVKTLGEQELKITAGEERKTQLARQRGALEAELRAAAAQHNSASQSLGEARERRQEIDGELAHIEARLRELSQEIDQLEADRQTRNYQTTDAKVELAKSEERLGNLRTQMQQFEENQRERQRAIAESRQQLAECGRRADESQWIILRAESEVAELYLKKEAYATRTVRLINQREEVQHDRREVTAQLQRVRAAIRQLDEKVHAEELDAGEVRHERSALANRLREDYGIELAELEHEPTDEEQHQHEEVQEEIDELRRKINNLGNVNLEALDELQQLETRHKTLSDQHQDLADAKNSLERIIDRINTDSRRLFAETLETVKGHFQSLFRDLFGGGQADIVLEEGADILETGIEIVARPPGKEPRSISLLSGGEKTLTCVALLLAIFRSRPSPFCVLDEVDAALDEANIDRFIKVLRDFLAWTQFIIVTHSKKTMTCANTIYGVTMQESGVSKQVSVRFDDVSETGEILTPPTRKTDTPPPAAEDDETQAA